MIVGFIVAFFTLVQTRQSILGLGVPPWGFEFVAFAILSAVTYSMLRLVLYGSLSGVLMHAPVGLYEEFLRTRSIREFDHASVNEFASYSLVRYTRLRGFLYKARVYDSRKAKRKVSYIFQLPMILSFVLASLFTTVMFGLSLEWSGGLVVVLVVVVFLEKLSGVLALPTP